MKNCDNKIIFDPYHYFKVVHASLSSLPPLSGLELEKPSINIFSCLDNS
ncbi:hypothetical protein M8C21_028491 [Ambrosia artemisiifolia]|uniref:Uncharacterized protein n=1 Tax=Ambrosia artemisiifolia TaxID=4212 RepID=A0AAD5GYU0_AMBAR|nr:hypothetical protein M8C21_028491 [Ambrosia artemisiifolia]